MTGAPSVVGTVAIGEATDGGEGGAGKRVTRVIKR